MEPLFFSLAAGATVWFEFVAFFVVLGFFSIVAAIFALTVWFALAAIWAKTLAQCAELNFSSIKATPSTKYRIHYSPKRPTRFAPWIASLSCEKEVLIKRAIPVPGAR